MTHMKAAVLAAPRTFEVRSVPLPEPRDGELRIQVEGCGVCGSNLEAWEGRPWFRYPVEPGASGHEGWGIVDKLGGGVRDFRPGDRVAALSSHAFAEFDVVPAGNVVRLPRSLEGRPCPAEALGCAVNILRRSRIVPGETVAVLGVGFLGALLVQLASREGARVIAASRREFSLKIAREMGAAEARRLDGTEGLLCDCVIEATGRQQPLDLAARLLREGGRLVIAGYHQDGPRRVDMQLWNWRALDIINAHERDVRKNVGSMAAAVELVAAGRLDPAPLYSHPFRLEEIGRAFRCLSERPDGFSKALIVP